MAKSGDTIWAELRAFLDDEYGVNDHGFDLLGVRMRDGTVGVRRRDDVVEINAAIRNVRHVDYARALAITAELTEGSLCLMGGALFVRQVIPLVHADPETVRSSLLALARLGSVLGTKIGAARERAPDVFAHMVD